MFFDYDRYTYYVTPGGTDMRKGADSLARLVWEQMHLDSRSRSMFLFFLDSSATSCANYSGCNRLQLMRNLNYIIIMVD